MQRFACFSPRATQLLELDDARATLLKEGAVLSKQTLCSIKRQSHHIMSISFKPDLQI
jgi:hypothetical protein